MKNKRVLPLIIAINCTKLYDPGAYGSVYILPTKFSYYIMPRLWPWKTIGFFFLSWWWLITPSYMVLEVTIRYLSCLQSFPIISFIVWFFGAYVFHITFFKSWRRDRSSRKGLKPKLHDFTLSIGDNKTLNLKYITSLKLLQDIMLFIFMKWQN
jgi:hypothetical protein